MATVKVTCPYCGSEEELLYGRSRTGKQRLLCRNPAYRHKIFQLEYAHNACRPGTKEKIVEMAMNGAEGAGYGARIGYFPQYSDSSLKKTGKFAKPVNEAYLKKLEAEQETDIEICNALATEMDEMRSFYHDKSHQIWL